ncbi:MAG: RnfABCDGE type electron transport complex subunit D [Candidatus Hydrogenedentes bacterium]|nr:RnfABCDGE type electron transport complex subunit D [Candidatus Hydrogenedentota bacterium]
MVVSVSPHFRGTDTIQRVMFDVVLALIPAVAAGVYFFGGRALWIVLISVATAVGTEAILQRLTRKPISVADCSAIITGILLALNLPPAAPYWLPIVGAVVAIAIAKMVFGGLGKNIFNPALIGRAVLLAAYPVAMTKGWLKPLWWHGRGFFTNAVANPQGVAFDAISCATPLVKEGVPDPFTLGDLIIGKVGGCIGETSAICIIIGGLYLLARKRILWQMPVAYIGSFALLTALFGGARHMTVVQEVFAGGLMLGAWFMATDMVTSPLTGKGQLVGGILCGLLTFVIRLKGGYPEGVSYSILIMNVATPLIDRYTQPRRFGAGSHAEHS